MKPVYAAVVFSQLQITLSKCKEPPLIRQSPGRADRVAVFSTPENDGDLTDGSPYPTITEQRFIPEYSLRADRKTLTWRIEWPTCPANMGSDRVPTVFRLSK
ncbi:MAG: hypothetical protein U0X91_04125 [Spirosomataceae bacterium]